MTRTGFGELLRVSPQINFFPGTSALVRTTSASFSELLIFPLTRLGCAKLLEVLPKGKTRLNAAED